MSSQRSQVPPFTVMTVLAAVAAARTQGRDVISLCAGEPGQGAPSDVRHRASEVLTDGTALGYSEAMGIRPLREAIARHYRHWYGLDIDPERIAVTTGSSGAFLLTFLAAFDAGDRVALARPGYPAYRNILTSLGCEVVEVDCGADVRFQPTVDLLAAEHARSPLAGVVLASPANPTGTMIPPDQLRSLMEWADDNGVRVVSDEIYHGVTYGDSVGTCAISASGSAAVVSSFSKYWGMTGWRLGWAVLPPDLVAPVDALAGSLALCAPVPAQHAAVAAFTDRSYEEGVSAVQGFAQARALVLDALPRLRWTDVAPADGAFYVYAGIAPVIGPYRDSVQWCAALLAEADVALTPGVDFDSAHGDTHIRLSLAAGPVAVAEAVRRVIAWQDALTGTMGP